MFSLVIMVPFRVSRTPRQDGTHIFDETTGTFVNTSPWMPRSIRELVLIEHLFHRPQVGPRNLTDAPLFREPRLECVFFNVRLMRS